MIYTDVLVAAQAPTLNQQVRVACMIASEAIRTEAPATTNHANRLLWAKQVFNDPVTQGNKMIWAVLAQNVGASLAAVQSATDATVQTAVNAAVDVLANGS